VDQFGLDMFEALWQATLSGIVANGAIRGKKNVSWL